MDRQTLSTTFEMTKPGHLKKLTKAIKQLKYPTAGNFKFLILNYFSCFINFSLFVILTIDIISYKTRIKI